MSSVQMGRGDYSILFNHSPLSMGLWILLIGSQIWYWWSVWKKSRVLAMIKD